jgi:hypothetical protein
MPTFEGGGRVKDTYGLENAAEMIRRQGREGDTVLAHITPQEAGILKLLGGSGTTNPYTGLPEFKLLRGLKKIPVIGKPLYKLGSEVGQAIEGGIESIARNKILGPIAQMASYLHPVSAFLYAGLAPEGSSFDTKGAAKAAVMQQIAQGVKEYAMGTPAGGGIGSEGASMSDLPYSGGGYGGPGGYGPGGFDADIGLDVMSGGPGTAPPVGAVESAVTSAAADPLANVQAISAPASGIGESLGQYASAGTPTMTDVPTTSGGGGYDVYDYGDVPTTSAPPSSAPDMSGFEGGINERGGSYKPDYNLPPVVDRSTPLTDYSGVRGLDPAGENFLGAAGSLAEGAYDLAASNPMTTAAVAYGGYTAYQTKKELDDAKEEAERILRDQANKKAEEIAWAQGVLRDYPYNYRRLTEEDVRRERGMAMGGRINSYDDEMGSDDGMMQGGIAALAKGGLPPRYLRGGGDGMSDSIRARIGGKQEARLADGEFVVPADVVSHLGNGSSNAGAKRLYEMMNRVRKSRTGKTRQAPEVNTRKMMPV